MTRTNKRIDWHNVAAGLFLLAIGLAKKVFLADPLVPLVAAGFDHATTIGTSQAWLSALAYTLQIYFDFSGYTDMALGAALIFNIRLPINFDSPYRSLDLRDFWHRWHMTLSRFLREYLYVPLGGNRASESRVLANLLLTFLLGGLWHGAAWTFVVWGAYHGLLLSVYRAAGEWWDRLPLVARRLGMFLLAVIGWVFFRATSFAMATTLLVKMFSPASGVLVPQPSLAFVALVIAAWWAMLGPNAFEMRHEYRLPGRMVLASGLAAALAIVIGLRSSPFLYFQF